jgi:xeroderma pigmentosum group C-complementing protein
MSLTPLRLQNAFFSYSRETHPNERDRARLFDAAMRDLTSWWWQVFVLEPGAGIKNRSFDEVHAETRHTDLIATLLRDPERLEANQDANTEVIRNAKSLMKRAVLMRGSADVSAQLFVSLCRSLDIPARLVYSLQPVDWRTSLAATSKSRNRANLDFLEEAIRTARTGTSSEADEDSDDVEMEPVVLDEAGPGPATLAKRLGRATSATPSASQASLSGGSIRGSAVDSSGEDRKAAKTAVRPPPVRLRRPRPQKTDPYKSPSPGAHLYL